MPPNRDADPRRGTPRLIVAPTALVSFASTSILTDVSSRSVAASFTAIGPPPGPPPVNAPTLTGSVALPPSRETTLTSAGGTVVLAAIEVPTRSPYPTRRSPTEQLDEAETASAPEAGFQVADAIVMSSVTLRPVNVGTIAPVMVRADSSTTHTPTCAKLPGFCPQYFSARPNICVLAAPAGAIRLPSAAMPQSAS